MGPEFSDERGILLKKGRRRACTGSRGDPQRGGEAQAEMEAERARQPQARELPGPPGTRRREEGFPLEPLERGLPCQHLDFGILAFRTEKVHFYCLKLLRFCSFVLFVCLFLFVF